MVQSNEQVNFFNFAFDENSGCNEDDTCKAEDEDADEDEEFEIIVTEDFNPVFNLFCSIPAIFTAQHVVKNCGRNFKHDLALLSEAINFSGDNIIQINL